MDIWINGKQGAGIDCRDRGLQYGDGVFETMRVRHGAVRLLEYHLDRLYSGCARLGIEAPAPRVLRRELKGVAARRTAGVLKLIVTRGTGSRGYRPKGTERCTRILSLHALPRTALENLRKPVRVRVCGTSISSNPLLAGIKTLNRLESVMARMEWSDHRIWEGLMRDVDGNIVCGTMSNLFLVRGSRLLTPLLDRGGVAGVMRRWILESAGALELRAVQGRVRWTDLVRAEEVFMSNAVVGVVSVGSVEWGNERMRPPRCEAASHFLDRLRHL